ncbi:MAG TPA: sporulation protein [Candidatus Dormibacteraeota bacterium]|nr:sporulation protein [Candidatus Dormibacteraeota bacterium]
MNVDEMLTGARDAVTVKRVYGDPIERDGILVVPAAKVSGGGGGGADAQNNGGGGFGIAAKPAGAWVIKGGEVEWQPALDINRIVLGGQIVAIFFFLFLRTLVKSRAAKR